MTLFMTFTVLGLVLGAVYAIAASGLVLTYNTSGIFNFAHGAQAMIGAFVYYQLQVVWGVPTPVSLALVLLVVGPLMGFLLHRFIMGGLRDTAEVTKIVVTVAILLGFVSLSQWAWDPQEARMSKMFFGADSYVTVAGITIRYHEIICLLAAAAIAVALRLLFTRSRMGVLMRATVDDPDLLRLNGHDPDRVAALAWALGSTLAVLAGILITPVAGGALEANALTLLVIDAFAAALFGRLRSIPRTFVGAMFLGLASTYLVAYAPSEWTWVTNLRDALPMIVLFLVLLVLPQDRLRGAAVRTRERYEVPTVRRAAIWAVAMVVATVAFRQLIDDSSVGTLVLGLSFAIIALSLTVLTGYAGELNLAPVSFGAIGTIVAFHTGIEGSGLDARMNLVGLAAGVLAAALTGALVALPALRLRGLYLALATLAFGGIVSSMVLRETQSRSWFGHDVALFPNGNLGVPRPKFLGIDFAPQANFLMLLTTVFAVLGVALIALRRSGYGRRLAALKDSPAACATLGMDVVRLKLSVFMLSAALAGLGGCLFAQQVGAVTADRFSLFESMSMLMLLVVAGMGYVSGGFAAGLLHGAVFVVMQGLFAKLGTDHPAFADQLDWFKQFSAVLPALIGISLGRNPSGFLHDSYRDWGAVIRHRTPVFLGGVAVELGAWFLAFQDVIGGWTFALFTIAWTLVLPRLAPRTPREASTPVELIGVMNMRAPAMAFSFGLRRSITSSELTCPRSASGFRVMKSCPVLVAPPPRPPPPPPMEPATWATAGSDLMILPN